MDCSYDPSESMGVGMILDVCNHLEHLEMSHAPQFLFKSKFQSHHGPRSLRGPLSGLRRAVALGWTDPKPPSCRGPAGCIHLFESKRHKARRFGNVGLL